MRDELTVAEIYKASWAFWELRARTAADLKTSRIFGVARSTYVGSPFRNTRKTLEKSAVWSKLKELPFSF
jgi:hypothetical protein